jgi:hypothetical protein
VHLRTARLSSAAGYNDELLVYSSLSFDLWALPAISGCYVWRGNKLFELWSPNSKQLPFLPGEHFENGTPSIHEDLLRRCFDEHAGKFECLYAPQYFHLECAHYAFMRRSHLVTSSDAAYEANRTIVEVWICSSNNLTHGRLPSFFLEGLRTVLRRFNQEMERLCTVHEPQIWANQPDYATKARLQALERMDVWSDMVDHE